MTNRQETEAVTKPQWDGARVTFQIRVAGQTVDCAISRAALQDLGGWRHFSPAELLRCFTNAQARIERAAAEKFAAQSESVYSVVSIWSDDLEDAPADGDLPESIEPQRKTKNGKGSKKERPRTQEAEGGQEGGAGNLIVSATSLSSGETG